jgi:cytosine/adenosine deaminase-related metal-dependent hydrolase
LIDALAFSAQASWVDRVWVAGKPIVIGGRHPRRESIVASSMPFLTVD